ncbi:hypothetical protein EDEG_02172 [Edhazardia aedis USNM 41457]|uniref:Uncharacterized protein n=1 Tax=Edhazardia aedis (strain USNM 41457) TaxID=1003232 RepID=J8ZUZ4_EDHAE|nr:hypothetical protein EDEG_02172 [Edhazardia aedis USNM 41457]|eukprot:EJW03498.1 hypothetical protein EDEG_02172 [Edhazardia aedis USNM 41457]
MIDDPNINIKDKEIEKISDNFQQDILNACENSQKYSLFLSNDYNMAESSEKLCNQFFSNDDTNQNVLISDKKSVLFEIENKVATENENLEFFTCLSPQRYNENLYFQHNESFNPTQNNIDSLCEKQSTNINNKICIFEQFLSQNTISDTIEIENSPTYLYIDQHDIQKCNLVNTESYFQPKESFNPQVKQTEANQTNSSYTNINSQILQNTYQKLSNDHNIYNFVEESRKENITATMIEYPPFNLESSHLTSLNNFLVENSVLKIYNDTLYVPEINDSTQIGNFQKNQNHSNLDSETSFPKIGHFNDSNLTNKTYHIKNINKINFYFKQKVKPTNREKIDFDLTSNNQKIKLTEQKDDAINKKCVRKFERVDFDRNNNLKFIFDAVFLIFPGYKELFFKAKLNFKKFFIEKLNSFDSEMNLILFYVELASPIFDSLKHEHNKINLANAYISALEIFVNPDKLKENKIRLRPFWLTISLFFPEIPGFVKMLAEDYFALIEIKTQKIVNLIFENSKNKIKHHLVNKVKKDNSKNNTLNSFIESQQVIICKNSVLINTFCSFFDKIKIFLEQELIEIAERQINFTMEIRNEYDFDVIKKMFSMINYQYKIQQLKIYDIFLYVLLAFPDDILNKNIKIYYHKICLLYNCLQTNVKGKKSDFFTSIKYNCIFDLDKNRQRNTEYHINRLLNEYLHMVETGNESTKKNQKFINNRKNVCSIHMRSTLFNSGAENILENIFEKLAFFYENKEKNDKTFELMIKNSNLIQAETARNESDINFIFNSKSNLIHEITQISLFLLLISLNTD